MRIEEAEELRTRFIDTGLHCAFFAPFEHTPDNEAANHRIPVVLVDRDICPFPQRRGFDLVGIDNFTGGYLLAEHLIKLGARRLAFVTRPFSATTIDARIAAFAAHRATALQPSTQGQGVALRQGGGTGSLRQAIVN